MMVQTLLSKRQGFTLIELIVSMVLVGVAAAIAGVGFMSFTNIGSGKEAAENANLAQQRLELILAEKLKNGFPGTGPGPDPCPVTGIDGCSLTPTFANSNDGGDCISGSSFDYCTVTVTVDSRDYHMRLYKY
jgi:prepilin-type N-terminal cleavage/methylation domain-containing protein